MLQATYNHLCALLLRHASVWPRATTACTFKQAETTGRCLAVLPLAKSVPSFWRRFLCLTNFSREALPIQKLNSRLQILRCSGEAWQSLHSYSFVVLEDGLSVFFERCIPHEGRQLIRKAVLTNWRWATIDASTRDAVVGGATSDTRHATCGRQSTLRRATRRAAVQQKQQFVRTRPALPTLLGKRAFSKKSRFLMIFRRKPCSPFLHRGKKHEIGGFGRICGFYAIERRAF